MGIYSYCLEGIARYSKIDNVKSPEDLLRFMKDIKYKHTGYFLSSDEVISKNMEIVMINLI